MAESPVKTVYYCGCCGMSHLDPQLNRTLINIAEQFAVAIRSRNKAIYINFVKSKSQKVILEKFGFKELFADNNYIYMWCEKKELKALLEKNYKISFK